jgi:hypothetical protein
MSDELSTNPAGCLARVLTWIGVAWFLLIILAGMGVLSEFGISGEIIARLGGTLVPALVLIAAGRALRRRARRQEEAEEGELRPDRPSGGPQPDMEAPRPVLISSRETTPPEPVEERGRVARSLEAALAELETGESESPQPLPIPEPPLPPRTSQEMIDEARRKWGSGGRI